MSESAVESRMLEPISGRPAPPGPGEACDGAGIAYPQPWHETIELDCDRPSDISIHSRSIGDASFAAIASPPVTVTQSPAGDASHRFHVVVLHEGHGEYEWARGTVAQRPGDIVLVDTSEPSRTISRVRSRLVRWSFPEALIAPFMPLSDCSPVVHLPADQGLMKVVAQHTQQIAREADRLEPGVQRSLLSHLCGLLGLAVEAQRAPGPTRRGNYRAFQRQRVLSYIETHLSSPHCTAKRAASDLGISVRWLHALLEDMEDSFTDLVARRRLDDSLERLRDPAWGHLSIAEIAFHSGFNDLSTFYRRFGERYGTTPGEARRGNSLASRPPAQETASRTIKTQAGSGAHG